MPKLNKLLSDFINQSKDFGIAENDFQTAKVFFKYNESGLAFEIVLVQLYDYGLKIDQAYYDHAVIIAIMLGLPETDYKYFRELIR
jgi:hypothetical protein